MKKVFVILGVLCALIIGGSVYSYTNATPPSCSSVSGAKVTTEIKGCCEFCVWLVNNSGSRCSASFKVYGKLSNGEWEYAGSGILTADNGSSDVQRFSMGDYTRMRADDISTWKCN